MPDTLVTDLKVLIIESLKLEDIRPEDIPDDEPLFGSSKLGLDSIDALELVVRLERKYGIKIGSSEESRSALATVATLAAYIRAHSPAHQA